MRHYISSCQYVIVKTIISQIFEIEPQNCDPDRTLYVSITEHCLPERNYRAATLGNPVAN